MRDAVVSALADAATSDPRIVLLIDSASGPTIRSFRAMVPDQCYDIEGSADAMIGMAAGLAMNDHRVFVFVTAPVLTFRTCEFLRNEVCRNRLPVTLIADEEDRTESVQNLVETLPGMRMIPVRDWRAARSAVQIATSADGPAFLRIG